MCYADEMGYKAYQLNDADIVAARTGEEAFNWFLDAMEVTDDEIDNLYEKPIRVDMDEPINYVHTPDDHITQITFRELIQLAIKDKLDFPCIIATFDWLPTISQP